MRIVWIDDRFQAELPPGENWRDDMELVRSVGFKSSGPPDWTWHTSKFSLLDKLRAASPKSGLTITEVALDKYKFLKQQFEKKTELKKLFENAKKEAEEAAAPKWETYQDPDTGITCFVVKPIEEVFTWTFHPPAPPDRTCFMCGSYLYLYDLTDICLWCDKIKLDKKTEI